jgi:hypothetical protein
MPASRRLTGRLADSRARVCVELRGPERPATTGADDAASLAGYGSTVSTHGVPVGPYPEQADPVEYERLRRRVLWKLPTGLYLLGSRAGERRNLMTMNWVMQVSIDPKHVAVSVEASAVSYELIVDGGCFSVALLARDNKEVVRSRARLGGPHALRFRVPRWAERCTHP